MRLTLIRFANFSILLICLQIIYSCGIEATEKDKHPKLSVLPNLSSSKFEVIKFPNNQYTFEGIYNNLLYLTCTENNNEYGYGGTKLLSIYDTSFQKIISFPIKYDQKYIDKSGNLFCHFNDTLLKYTYPKFHPVQIVPFPYNHKIIFNKLYDSLKIVKSQNKVILDDDLIKNELTKKILASSPKKQNIKYIQLREAVILMIGNKIFWLSDENLDKSIMNKVDDFSNYLPNTDNFQNKKLSVFDKVGLNNESYGNHFSFGHYQSGLEYFNLVLLNDTIQFKYPSKFLNNKSLIEIDAFEQNNSILILSEENDLYLVKHL